MPTRVEHVFAGIGVSDYAASLAWYERLFGRAPDVVVKEDEAMWQIAGAGWVYVVYDVERAGKALLTMLVDDLEAHMGELEERGISTGDMETEPGFFRRIVVTDVDGNTIAIGEDLSSGKT